MLLPFNLKVVYDLFPALFNNKNLKEKHYSKCTVLCKALFHNIFNLLRVIAETAGLPVAVSGLKQQLFYKNRKTNEVKALLVTLRTFNMQLAQGTYTTIFSWISTKTFSRSTILYNNSYYHKSLPPPILESCAYILHLLPELH